MRKFISSFVQGTRPFQRVRTLRPIQRALILTIFGLVLLVASNYVGELQAYQGAQVAVYIVAISSIIVLTGYSGQISLGHGALMAIGGYGTALSFTEWNFPWPMAIIFGVVVGTIFGAILGIASARLQGPYLAGTTLALAVGLPSVADQFKILGGEQGLGFDIGDPPAWLQRLAGGNFTQYQWFFWLTAIAALFIFWATTNVLQSSFGRNWRAVRNNPTAASLAGINVPRWKILAFTVSACLASLSGALLALLLGLVTPTAFPLSLSFLLITGAVVAGLGRLGGSILGSVILVSIPELSGALATHFGDSQKLTANLPGIVSSLMLIIVVIFAPNGLSQIKLGRKPG
jgi:branched-chain amino acid transport system permease protein